MCGTVTEICTFYGEVLMHTLRVTVSYDIEVLSLRDSTTLIPRLIEEAGKHPRGACVSAEFEQGKLYASARDTPQSVLEHFGAAQVNAMLPRNHRRGRR